MGKAVAADARPYTIGDGQTRPASVMYTALDGTTPPLGALFIIEGAPSAALSDVPEWACGTR